MKRDPLNALITTGVLNCIYDSGSAHMIDRAMEGDLEGVNFSTRNACAKITTDLYEKMSGICSVLEISKRSFIEAAIIRACEEAERIMEEEGLYEALRPQKEEAA